MGISIGEIRNSNEKYYYKNYFSRVRSTQIRWIIFSISIIILFQYVAYNIICELVRQGYFEQAKHQNLGIKETADWVNEQMEGMFFNKVFTIMLIATMFIIIYTIVTYLVNSIHMYIYKKLLVLVPVFTFIAEILAVAGFNQEVLIGNIRILCTLAVVCIMKTFFEMLISGITLPIEVKAPCIKIINKIFDKALENL